MERVVLPRTLVNDLLHQAQQAPEREVCGLVGARDGAPVHCYAVRNVDPRPARRFFMDPQGEIDAFRAMRAGGEELFAIFHSHPAAPAFPTHADLEGMGYPHALFLIVSLNTRGVLEMRGFRLRGGGVEEVEVGL